MAKMTEIPIETDTETDGNSSSGSSFSVGEAPLPEPPGSLKIPPPVSKAAIDTKAEEIKKQRELPPKPGNNVSFPELCKWLRLLNTEEKRKRISLFVYRHYPVIIRQQANPDADNNIDVIVDGFERLDERHFIEAHGGGTYGIIVADCEGYRDKKTTSGFFSAKLEIPISEHEPKLNLIEVEWDNPKNRGFQAWARAKGLIDSRNMPITPGQSPIHNNTGNTNSDNTVQVMKVMMDFFSKMNDNEKSAVKKSLESGDPMSKAIGELMVEKLKQDDPNKTATMFSTMLNAMTTAMNSGKKDSGDGGIATIMPMFQMMMQSQSENTKMIVELMKAREANENSSKGGEGPSSLSQLRELIEVAKELKGESHSKQSTTEMLIDKGLEVLNPALGIICNIVALKMSQIGVNPVATSNPTSTGAPVGAMASMANANRNQPQQSQQSTQQRGPQPLPPPNPNPMQQPQQSTMQPSMQDQSQIMQPNLQDLINQFGPLIVANFNKDGYLLPDMVVSFFPQGDMLVATIIRHGTDEIVNKLKASPGINWPQIEGTYGEEFVRKWVDDFVHYKEILAEIEGEEGEDGEENEEDEKTK